MRAQYRAKAPRGPSQSLDAIRSALWYLCSFRVFQDGNERQIAVTLSEVEAIADDKVIGNLESEIVDLHVLFTPFKLIEQSRQLNAGRPPGFKILQQIRKSQTSINDVFHHEYVATFDGHVQIFHDAHFARGARG